MLPAWVRKERARANRERRRNGKGLVGNSSCCSIFPTKRFWSEQIQANKAPNDPYHDPWAIHRRSIHDLCPRHTLPTPHTKVYCAVHLGRHAQSRSNDTDWRVSYRKDGPEKDPVPAALLQRRLQAQKYAKRWLATLRSKEYERLLVDEKLRAKKSQKTRRQRLQFKESISSSSSCSSEREAA